MYAYIDTTTIVHAESTRPANEMVMGDEHYCTAQDRDRARAGAIQTRRDETTRSSETSGEGQGE